MDVPAEWEVEPVTEPSKYIHMCTRFQFPLHLHQMVPPDLIFVKTWSGELTELHWMGKFLRKTGILINGKKTGRVY